VLLNIVVHVVLVVLVVLLMLSMGREYVLDALTQRLGQRWRIIWLRVDRWCSSEHTAKWSTVSPTMLHVPLHLSYDFEGVLLWCIQKGIKWVDHQG